MASSNRNRYKKRAQGWAATLRRWGGYVVAALVAAVALLGGILPHLAALLADGTALVLVAFASGLVALSDWMRRESNSEMERLLWLVVLVAVVAGALVFLGVM